MNGATQTFRRPSLATNTSHQRETSQNTPSVSTPSAGVYVPPHLNSNYHSSSFRNGLASENRYSKDQLLNMYKGQRESGTWGRNIADLFMGDWNPHEVGGETIGMWSKKDEHKEGVSGPELCWDHSGKVEPLGLIDMNDEEKEVSLLQDFFAPCATC